MPDENLLGFLAPLEDSTHRSIQEIVSEALQHQTNGTTLAEAAGRAKQTAIAYNGKSAACVSVAYLLTKQLLERGIQNVHLLEAAPDPTQPSSVQAPIENGVELRPSPTKHDVKTSSVVKVGQLEDGSEILVNERFANADMRCVVANVVISPFWGYSGGPSFVVPGLASEKTLKACLAPSLKTERLPGVLSGNPTHEVLLRASQTTRVDFAIHIVEHTDRKVAGAFAGDFMETFEQACALAAKMFRPPVRRKADIVISSAGGNPLDRSLFEVSPSAVMAGDLCKDHGTIILVAECSGGIGAFPLAGLAAPEAKARLVHVRRLFSLEMLLEHSFRKISGEHRTYLVSTLPEHQASLYDLLDAKSVRSALERAIRHAGKDATIALVPYGSHTAPITA